MTAPSATQVLSTHAAPRERHPEGRLGWLRAAVLGANDGIVSTASLIAGMVASSAPRAQVLIAGAAGVVAGALSMAAGEYVSVGTQADAENADVQREKDEQATDWDAEHEELREIYVRRGLTQELADEVARQLMRHDALGSHLRDELGMGERTRARPLQAALVSALSFALGAVWPLLAAAWTPPAQRLAAVTGLALLLLFVTGGLAGRLGRANPLRAALRVGVWGALAMAATALLGRWVGAALG